MTVESAPTAPVPAVPATSLPSWLLTLISNPAQAIALVGVLVLGTFQGVDVVRGDPSAAPLATLESEIARRDVETAKTEAVAQATANSEKCLEALIETNKKIDKLAKDVEVRSDETFAFVGELAQYAQRVTDQLTKTSPETGPRLDEYIRKSLLRGYGDDKGAR